MNQNNEYNDSGAQLNTGGCPHFSEGERERCLRVSALQFASNLPHAHADEMVAGAEVILAFLKGGDA